MELLRTIGLMLLALSILIVIHELGHYWAARMFKIRVERFFLFFDYKFKLFSLKKGETEYGVGWIPLGGYVKIAGMLDESMDGQAAVGPAQPWEFRSKPIWQRLIVMLGGIIMNVILGCVIFIGLKFLVGDRVTPMDKLEFGIVVDENSVLHPLGFRTGDKILSYNGKAYPSLEDYSNPSKLVDSEKIFEVRHADGQVEKISLPDSIMGKFQDSGEPALFMPDMAPILHVLEYDAKKVTDAMARNPQMDTAEV
ncbi:MAG: metalloprotease RseP, partial [Bacteroidota bacterium]